MNKKHRKHSQVYGHRSPELRAHRMSCEPDSGAHSPIAVSGYSALNEHHDHKLSTGMGQKASAAPGNAQRVGILTDRSSRVTDEKQTVTGRTDNKKPHRRRVHYSNPIAQVQFVSISGHSREARLPHWTMVAIDSKRFQRRIRQVEPEISRCLHEGHRDRMGNYIKLSLQSVSQGAPLPSLSCIYEQLHPENGPNS